MTFFILLNIIRVGTLFPCKTKMEENQTNQNLNQQPVQPVQPQPEQVQQPVQ